MIHYDLTKLLGLKVSCNLDALFLLKDLEVMKGYRKTWKLWKISKYRGLKWTGARCNEMFGSMDNCVQNIFEKLEKSNKVVQEQEKLYVCFCITFEC